MRLFFALWPDDAVRRQLSEAARTLEPAARARLVRSQNFHVTLAFVGEVPDSKLAVLQQIGAALRSAAFEVTCDSLEYWPRSAAVVTAAREMPLPLLDLRDTLCRAAELPREAFRAHVTLARKVAQAPVLPAMSPIRWRATHFSLIRSQTGGSESAYTVVDTWPLLYER